jgi:hypothetical protein
MVIAKVRKGMLGVLPVLIWKIDDTELCLFFLSCLDNW